MTIKFIRFLFLVFSSITGYYLGSLMTALSVKGSILGALVGAFVAVIIMVLEVKMKYVSLRNLSAAAFGLIFGFLMAWMVTLIIRMVPMDEVYYGMLRIIFTLILCYLGMVLAIKGNDEFNIIIPYVRFSHQEQKRQLSILDTSAIIDGRIIAVSETGFIEGRLVVPRFVLHELQYIADSPDESKRVKGRRGLDMLEKLKKISGIEVIIHDENLPEIKEVDAKLIRLAKMLSCQIVTTDFNLNKVAKIENVKVLNVNELGSAVRLPISTGEQMNVFIKKDGKERNQGVAFMEDGTMIVVENARKSINKSVNIIVTSVLQTSSGRMIFADLIEKKDSVKNGNNRKNTERSR